MNKVAKQVWRSITDAVESDELYVSQTKRKKLLEKQVSVAQGHKFQHV